MSPNISLACSITSNALGASIKGLEGICVSSSPSNTLEDSIFNASSNLVTENDGTTSENEEEQSLKGASYIEDSLTITTKDRMSMKLRQRLAFIPRSFTKSQQADNINNALFKGFWNTLFRCFKRVPKATTYIFSIFYGSFCKNRMISPKNHQPHRILQANISVNI